MERFRPYVNDSDSNYQNAEQYAEETALEFLRWRELGYWHYFPINDIYYNGKDPSLAPYTPSELYTIFDNERKQQK